MLEEYDCAVCELAAPHWVGENHHQTGILQTADFTPLLCCPEQLCCLCASISGGKRTCFIRPPTNYSMPQCLPDPFFCVTAGAWWRCRPHLSALGSSTDLSLDGLVLSLAMPHAFANAPGNKSWFCPRLALFHVCVMASMKWNSIMVHWVDLPKAPVIKDTRENSSYCSEEKLCVWMDKEEHLSLQMKYQCQNNADTLPSLQIMRADCFQLSLSTIHFKNKIN